MDDAERAVAILDRIGQHSNGGEVVDLVKIFAQRELIGDAVDVLRPAAGVGLDADRGELTLEDLLDVIDVGLALFALACDLLDDLLVFLGVELGKREVFQFPLDVPHAEPVGQRRVDVQRLLGHRPAPVLRQVVDGPHVVQAVRQLHQHHPDVFRHGDQHLADVFRLRLLLAVEGDLLQLGHARHQLAHRRPEALLQVRDRQVGVLHGVVQDGGGQGIPIELQVGENAGHAQRMFDELLAGEPVLVVVGAGGRVIGAGQHLHVAGWQIADLG